LEGILGRMGFAQNTAANTENQRTMPLHQNGKCRLFAVGDESLQELAVRQVSRRLDGEGFPQTAEHLFQRVWGHRQPSS
jgi:hypothetical protein